ncbi:MAG: rod shape-determining protein MreC [Acutalibacteraceae bacterium]|nr:rod shape-determining protein MreC [Acutalibacteraceae bacterium]
MRFFFRTRRFRLCLSIICAVVALAIVIRLIGGILSPASSLIGTITAPFQDMATGISSFFTGLDKKFNEGNSLLLENQELKEELGKLRKSQAELDQTKRQNEFYKDYLEIKDQNPDFSFCDARLISIDKDDLYKNFVINKGSAHGIEAFDPVIVGNYLVGYISSVGITTSKVTTILSPEIICGANDSRTGDAGILSGAVDFAKDGTVKLYNLSRSCNVAVGDTIVTSGEGLFPEGLLIGSVQSIKSDTYTSSLYASVVPFADFEEMGNVMIITSFSQQGTLGEGLE